MICIACGKPILIGNIFCVVCKEDFARSVKKNFDESTNVDDMIFNDPKNSIAIGSKVKCRDTGSVGTIVFVALQLASFRVKWDVSKGIDEIDWFRGDQLERV